jgi:hypothetical protein
MGQFKHLTNLNATTLHSSTMKIYCTSFSFKYCVSNRSRNSFSKMKFLTVLLLFALLGMCLATPYSRRVFDRKVLRGGAKKCGEPCELDWECEYMCSYCNGFGGGNLFFLQFERTQVFNQLIREMFELMVAFRDLRYTIRCGILC